MSLGKKAKSLEVQEEREEQRLDAAPDDDGDKGILGDFNVYDGVSAGAGLALKATPAGVVQVVADVLSANKKLEDALERAIHKHPDAAEKLGGTPEEVLAFLKENYSDIYDKITETESTAGIMSTASLAGGGLAALAATAIAPGGFIIPAIAGVGGGMVSDPIARNCLGIGEDESKDVIAQVLQAASGPHMEKSLQALNDRLAEKAGAEPGERFESADSMDAAMDEETHEFGEFDEFGHGLPPSAFVRDRARSAREPDYTLAA